MHILTWIKMYKNTSAINYGCQGGGGSEGEVKIVFMSPLYMYFKKKRKKGEFKFPFTQLYNF